jgi:predicted ribonuclease toxin of YeeF-YezG toxin-antitoxin module
MATTTSDTPSVSAEETLKRQKKQARREAKLMRAIKEAKKDLKKAQKKQSKVQARLEERSTALHTLEALLAELRASSTQAASDATAQSATDEQQQEQSEMEGGIVPNDGKQLASPEQEHQDEMTSLTDQILASPHVEESRGGDSFSSETERSPSTDVEPTPLLGEEALPPEVMVVIKDATEGEAMQDNEAAVERAPAPTTPRKTSAHKTAAARTSTATKRPASRSQRTGKPSSDAGHEG